MFPDSLAASWRGTSATACVWAQRSKVFRRVLVGLVLDCQEGRARVCARREGNRFSGEPKITLQQWKQSKRLTGPLGLCGRAHWVAFRQQNYLHVQDFKCKPIGPPEFWFWDCWMSSSLITGWMAEQLLCVKLIVFQTHWRAGNGCASDNGEGGNSHTCDRTCAGSLCVSVIEDVHLQHCLLASCQFNPNHKISVVDLWSAVPQTVRGGRITHGCFC